MTDEALSKKEPGDEQVEKSLPLRNLLAESSTQEQAKAPLEPTESAEDALPIEKIIGSFDVCNATGISGWVASNIPSDKPLAVEILADDQLVCRVTTDILRSDLREAGIAVGQHGFWSMLPAHLFDGKDHVVALSGDNAPGQTVISGHATAVSEVIAAAGKREGGKAVRLPISVPCHCRLLRGAAERLEAELRQIDFRDCTVPVIPNCDPALLHSRERTGELLVRQIVSPVRWRETIERMAAMGVDTVVELGPKKTLTGLVKRIDRQLRFFNVEDGASLEKTLTALDG